MKIDIARTIRLWVLKWRVNKKPDDIKIYLYSIKINLYSIKGYHKDEMLKVYGQRWIS